MPFRKPRLTAILTAVALSLSLGVSAPAPAQTGDLALFAETDATMNEAILRARETLPAFLHQILDQNGRARGGTLKVSFQTFPQDVGNEVIWVSDFRRLPDGSFEGRLANQPFNLGNWREGTQVEFTYDSIADWGLPASNGQLFGNFTTRVIADQPGNEYLQQVLTPDPVPQSWR